MFERTELDGRPVLAVSGEIDLAVAGRFAQELALLIDDAEGDALINLSGVGFIDSSGVRELLKAEQAAGGAGRELVLLDPSPPCRHVLEISGVWSEFAVRSTRE
jgi:anti-sigma B factor antagonist